MLKGQIQTDFKNRDAKAVERAFLSMASNWKSARWLSNQNRYAKNCIPKLTQDWGPKGRVRHKHLAEYIAASVLVHCMDGWSYLGRSLGAQLAGDHDCARHLGYYAELRAAMAILGAHGVGVFSREHAAVNSKGRCVRVGWTRAPKTLTRPSGPGTHEFVWDGLEEWAASPDACDATLGCVRVGGQSLRDWLSHFASTPALTSMLTRGWLLAWGLDISRLAEDRDARNLSSYRPTSFSTGRPPTVGETLQAVSCLWRATEPRQDSPFSDLDRQLLRASLREAFRVTHNRSPRHAKRQFRLRIQSVIHYLKPASTPGFEWEAFLTEVDPDESSVLELASRNDAPDSSHHSLQVAARALLLMRIATGACERLLRTLPTSARSDLDYWIETIGQDRALWKNGNTPTSWRDLWKDPEDALGVISADLPQIVSYSDLWRRQPGAASVFSTFERVGLWGIAG